MIKLKKIIKDKYGVGDSNASDSLGTGGADDSISLPKSKIDLIKKLLQNVKENTERLEQLLAGSISEDEVRIGVAQASDNNFSEEGATTKVIEGVFDGEQMIGPDGKQYSMPANYASKSKLVEGDILKLSITGSGAFVYKQISPIERMRVSGELEKRFDGSFYVVSGKKKWKVITASVTYFKGEDGDEAVVLIPKTGDSQWGAIENIVKKAS